MIESIDSILENVTKAETITDNQRKSLGKINNEIVQLQSNIKTLKNETNTLTDKCQEMQKQITDKEYELSSLQQRCTVLDKMLSQKEETLDNENIKLDELQKTVWNERERFCSKARAFTSKYSISTNFHMLKFDSASYVNVSPHSGTSSSDFVIKDLEAEKTRLESELCNLNKSNICNRLSELLEERENLLKEPTTGKQFLELQQKLETASNRTKQFHLKEEMEALLENQQKKSHRKKKFLVDRHKRPPTDQTVLDCWLDKGKLMELNDKESNVFPGLVHKKECDVQHKGTLATSRNSESKMSTVKFVPKAPSSLFLNMREETQTSNKKLHK